jgi:hypothetical protein
MPKKNATGNLWASRGSETPNVVRHANNRGFVPDCREPIPQLDGELVAQSKVLQGDLTVATTEHREESKQVEQESDH